MINSAPPSSDVGAHHPAAGPIIRPIKSACHQPLIVARLQHNHQRLGTSSGTVSGHHTGSSCLRKWPQGRGKSSGTSSGLQLGTSSMIISVRAHLQAHYNHHYHQGSSPELSSRLQLRVIRRATASGNASGSTSSLAHLQPHHGIIFGEHSRPQIQHLHDVIGTVAGLQLGS